MTAKPHASAKTPPELTPRGCTNLRLRQVTRRVSRHYDAAVGASGLKTTQYSLLSFVAAMGPVRPTDLAAQMNLEASTLTRNLQPLIEQGFIELAPGENARSRLVLITDAGRAKRTEAQRLWKQAQMSLNDQLGVERVLRLHALLDECLSLLNAEGEVDE